MRLLALTLLGLNAYFLKNSLLNDKVKEIPIDEAFKVSKFRDSRNKDYSLSYLVGKERIDMIKGLEVINVITNKKEKL